MHISLTCFTKMNTVWHQNGFTNSYTSYTMYQYNIYYTWNTIKSTFKPLLHLLPFDASVKDDC